jgi:hypothetical protein
MNRYSSTSRGTFVLLVGFTVTAFWGSNLTAKEELLGVPFLEAAADTDHTLLREVVDKKVHSNLSHLENWTDYDGLPNHKALAIRYAIFANPFVPELYRHKAIEVNIGFWGGAWEFESVKLARERALTKCSGECIIYAEDNEKVGLEEVVDKYVKVQKAFLATEAQRYERAEFVSMRKRATDALTQTVKIALAPPTPLKVGYPDWQQDYAEVCQNRIFYGLRLIAGDAADGFRSELDAITRSGLYGRYVRSVNTVRNFTESSPGREMTNQMRFTMARDFSADPSFELPSNLSEVLKNEKITRVWLEGSVRVTSDGLPLAVDEYMSPLAVETGSHLYEGIEVRMPDGTGDCYVSLPFSGEALRFQVRDGDTGSATNALNLLLTSVRSKLEASPFLARPILNEAFAPGEFGMVRNEQPSNVLGAPNYERSTYLVQTWVAPSVDPFYSLYRRLDFQGVGAASLRDGGNVHAFLKVQHIFTAATHRLGEYREPSREAVERFEQLLTVSVAQAIEKACEEISGQMDNHICVVPPAGGTHQ